MRTLQCSYKTRIRIMCHRQTGEFCDERASTVLQEKEKHHSQVKAYQTHRTSCSRLVLERHKPQRNRRAYTHCFFMEFVLKQTPINKNRHSERSKPLLEHSYCQDPHPLHTPSHPSPSLPFHHVHRGRVKKLRKKNPPFPPALRISFPRNVGRLERGPKDIVFNW